MSTLELDLRAALRAERGSQAAAAASPIALAGLATVRPGIQAVLLYRASRWLLRHRLRAPAYVVALASSYFTGSEIAPTADIGPGFVVMHPAGTVVAGGVTTGSGLRLHGGSVLGYRLSRRSGDGVPTVGDDVIIGIGAKVLGPVSVGSSCVVGANAVVTGDVPPRHVAYGVPAVIRAS